MSTYLLAFVVSDFEHKVRAFDALKYLVIACCSFSYSYSYQRQKMDKLMLKMSFLGLKIIVLVVFDYSSTLSNSSSKNNDNPTIFKVAPSTENGVEFRLWARRDAVHQIDYALGIGPSILQYFEDFFDVKYPLPKQV